MIQKEMEATGGQITAPQKLSEDVKLKAALDKANQAEELDEAAKTLLAAADHLEKYGWCTGTLSRGEFAGPSCALGAISKVRGYVDPSEPNYSSEHWVYPDHDVGVERLAKFLLSERTQHPEYLPTPNEIVFGWNDDLNHETGRQTVIDTMRKAAHFKGC